MTDAVEVKLGADTSGATSAMGGAASSISQSLDKITSSLQTMGAQNKRVADEIKSENKNMSESFLRLHEGIKTGFDRVGGVFEGFSRGLLALGAIVAGGAMFKESVRGVIEEAAEVKKLQTVFGMAADDATQLNIALKLIGKTSEEYAGMAFKLQKQINANGDAMQQLGLSFRDANGNLLPLDETMRNAFKTIMEYEQGADRNAVALQLMGRSAEEAYGFFKLNESTMQRAAELQKAYGIEVGPEQQAQIKQYKMEQAALKIMFEQVSDKVGEALLPVLVQLAGWFNDAGPTTVSVFGTALKSVITVIQEVVMVFKVAVTSISVFFDNLITDVTTAGSLLRNVIEGNYSEIPKIIAARNEQIRRNNEAASEQILETWNETTDKVGKLWSDLPGGGGEDKSPKGGHKKAPNLSDGKGSGETRVGGWEAELAGSKDAYERMKLEQGSFEQFSKESESSYWSAILARTDLSAKEREEVLKKYYDIERGLRVSAFQKEIADLQGQAANYKNNITERIAIAEKEQQMIAQRYGKESKEAAIANEKIIAERRALAAQTQKVRDIDAKSQETAAMHELEIDKMTIDQQLAMQQISKTQAIAAEMDLENKKTAIVLAGIKDRLAAAEMDPDKNPELIAQLNAQIEVQEESHQKALTKLRMDAAQESAKYQIEAVNAGKGAFSGFLTDMQKGTTHISDAFNKMCLSIVDSMSQIASKKITEQLFEGAMGGGGSGGGGGGGMMSSLIGMFMGAGGAAYAQGTPYVPQDQLAVVHKGEAIVPAAQNKGGGGGGIVINFSAGGGNQPMDQRTQRQMAVQLGQEMQKQIKRSG